MFKVTVYMDVDTEEGAEELCTEIDGALARVGLTSVDRESIEELT